MMNSVAETLISQIQAQGKEFISEWQFEGYIPMDEGVLLYVKTRQGQPVVISLKQENEDRYHVEMVRNNDKFDRIVLGGDYDVPESELAMRIDMLLGAAKH
ncbi:MULTISPECIES: hypothetical protein [Shouchella]|uniref:Uncharacterized protein n=1 Tax=Shouchella rhizosphaerae TaxID=866786 RepID=A0ABZ2CVN9_9BACI|nr:MULTISPECIES: hypothetical protein [Shouchella]MCM3378333.1 hypothetical protein [Shouchella rhizosphaerae]PAD16657.1 hypothetical protein CHH73_12285 [Shouchella clausii]PAE83411.1 hypothetical protein CHH77_08050 [Shouchella clausii]